jgi:hypothetical protein
VFVVCCVGSGLYDGLITHSEEFYRVCLRVCVCVCVCLIVCDLETSTMRRPRPLLGGCATKKIYLTTDLKYFLFAASAVRCYMNPNRYRIHEGKRPDTIQSRFIDIQGRI